MLPLKVNFLTNSYLTNKCDFKMNDLLRQRFADGKHLSILRRGLIAEDMNANVGGAIMTNKRAYIFNVAPERQSLSKIKTMMEEKVYELMQGGNKIFGFICGGWKIDKNNDISKRSFDLYNTLADKMDDLKIPFGMICGKEIGNHYDNFRLRENNVYMWSDLVAKRFSNKESLSRGDILENLEKDYEFVEFAPEIQLVSSPKIVEPGKEDHFITLA